MWDATQGTQCHAWIQVSDSESEPPQLSLQIYGTSTTDSEHAAGPDHTVAEPLLRRTSRVEYLYSTNGTAAAALYFKTRLDVMMCHIDDWVLMIWAMTV